MKPMNEPLAGLKIYCVKKLPFVFSRGMNHVHKTRLKGSCGQVKVCSK